MLNVNYEALKNQIKRIKHFEDILQWLVDHNVTAQRIIDLGCGEGYETFGLLRAFGAKKVVGIDENDAWVGNARQLMREIQQGIRNLGGAPGTSEEEKRFWQKIPEFYKTKIFEDLFTIEFLEHDVTEPIEFYDNSFDLVFSRRLLHLIWYDQDRKSPEQDTQRVINEMKRLVKVGGTVATFSIVQFDDKPRFNLGNLFTRADLEIIIKDQNNVQNYYSGQAIEERYICKKNSQQIPK